MTLITADKMHAFAPSRDLGARPSRSARVAFSATIVRQCTHRNAYCFLSRKASTQSLADRRGGNAEGAPRRRKTGIVYAVYGDAFKLPTMHGGLFGVQRPSAIAGRIVGVRIKAIYRVRARWPMPHVLQERRKRSAPAVAYSNAATTPVGVIFEFRRIAAPFYCEPRSVFDRCASPPLVAMPGQGGCPLCDVGRVRSQKPRALDPKTSTGFGGPITQVAGVDYPFTAAVTGATPQGTTGLRSAFVLFHNPQSTEALSGNIDQFHVGCIACPLNVEF